MKTTKKILAALLVVLMLAMMIPVSASAAATYSVEVTSKEGFEFKLYKVADFDVATGTFSGFASDAVQSTLTNVVNGKLDSQAFLTACNALTDSQLGTPVATITDAVQKVSDLTPGAYFLKYSKVPELVTSVGNSAFAVPYIDNQGNLVTDVEINAGAKCTVGDEPREGKKFDGDGDPTLTADDKAVNAGDVVKYKAFSSIHGSVAEKLSKMEMKDTMEIGQIFNNDLKIYLTKDVVTEQTDFSELDLTSLKALVKDTDYTLTTTDTSFVATLSDSLIGSDEFYEYKTVLLYYSTTATDELPKLRVEGDPNVPGSWNHYTTEAENSHKESIAYPPVPPITVYSFNIDVVKVDSADNSKKLKGATFGLYADADCEVLLDTKETDENGELVFEGYKTGTYYVKELAAPEGYVLNPNVITVVLSCEFNGDKTATPKLTVNNTTVDAVKVENTRVIVPETGGAGTILFTICGATLVVLAGVLFLVVRRKKNA